MFSNVLAMLSNVCYINNMIRKYGAIDAVFGQEQYAQIPMAVVGIVMKFFQIVISIVVGMAAGYDFKTTIGHITGRYSTQKRCLLDVPINYIAWV